MRVRGLGEWMMAVVLAMGSAMLRFWALRQTPYANGWDAYFYLVQLKSWVEEGRLHSPEASLIYPYLRVLYALAGDYVLALKLGAAGLAGAFTLLVYCFCRRSREGWQEAEPGFRPSYALLLAAWFLFSPQLTYFAAQYPKNLLGLVLLLAFMSSLPLRPTTWRTLALPAMLLVLNYFGHRLTFALAMLYGLFWCLAIFMQQTSLWAWKGWKPLVSVGILVAVLLGLSGHYLPGLLQVPDMGRLKGVFSLQPIFGPWEFVRRFWADGRLSGWWLEEIGLSVAMMVFAAGWFLSKRGRRSAGPMCIALFALCLLLLFPFVEWSFTGIAYRFFLVFVLLAPLLAGVLPAKGGRGKALATVLLFLLAFFSWKSYDPNKHDPAYATFDKVTTRVMRQINASSSRPELLIAHNALAEYFTFSTGIDAMPWLPDYPVDSTRLWRLAYGQRLQTLRYYAGPGADTLVQPIDPHYSLLPEYCWQRALRHAAMEGDSAFVEMGKSWLNPARMRPEYLSRRHINPVTKY